ncbi:MAG: FHA domain-containing protein, partial [Candidatus Aminicenantes bacterium]|nr:FHA domain-containing protein [Candidatus Aminicenantes bacterium]
MILVLKFIRTTTPAYISLNKGKYLVGRDKKSDILIEHPTVSRKHCLIEFKKDKWIITDLGSKNGVFINENPVLTSGALKDGDKLKIGKVNLRVEIYPEEDYLIEKLSKLPV